MRIFETTPDGQSREEHDIVYAFKKFSKNLTPETIYLIKDHHHNLIWFTPVEYFLESFHLLLNEFHEISSLTEETLDEYVEKYKNNFRFFNDPSQRTLKDYLSKILLERTAAYG